MTEWKNWLAAIIKDSRVIYYTVEYGRVATTYVTLFVVVDNVPHRITGRAADVCGLAWHPTKEAIKVKGYNADLGLDVVETICDVLNLEFNHRSSGYHSEYREEGEITAIRW
jgi:hypothetical protein